MLYVISIHDHVRSHIQKACNVQIQLNMCNSFFHTELHQLINQLHTMELMLIALARDCMEETVKFTI